MNSSIKLDIIPGKAQFRPGEPLRFELRAAGLAGGHTCRWTIYDLEKPIRRGETRIEDGGQDWVAANIVAEPIAEGSGAYGLAITLEMPSGEELSAETAFDVAEHLREAPRYGFLSDFAPEELGKLEDVEFLNKHHINLVQFYDWMYRHDRLLADTDEFVDPLGRRISFRVVREKIAALRERGIASMAYAAVYGSLPDYAAEHPEELLYQNDGRPHTLGNYFHIMDISEDSAWTDHIIREFGQAIDAFGFDGLQLDQYGFPKRAIRKRGGRTEFVSLKELYLRFINLTRERLGDDVVLIYNNVSNYPTHTTASSGLDAMYIEVWDPESRFRDMKKVIDNARRWSGKQVVIAAYLPAFHPEHPAEPAEAEAGAVLAMATIFASGGYHILLGEERTLLADSYFPKYGAIGERFGETMRCYYDFIVMYRNLLFDLEFDDVSMTFTGGINSDVVFAKEGIVLEPSGDKDTVWTFVKEKPGWIVLQAINLVGIDNDYWKKPKSQAPTPVENIEIKVETCESIEGIWWATPDGGTILPKPLAYDQEPRGGEFGIYARFTLPRLDCWSLVYIKLREGVPADSFDASAFEGRG